MRMENLILRKHYGLHSLEPCYQQEEEHFKRSEYKEQHKITIFHYVL